MLRDLDCCVSSYGQVKNVYQVEDELARSATKNVVNQTQDILTKLSETDNTPIQANL